MPRNNRDEQLPEDNTNANNVCEGFEDDKDLTALQEKTQSKPRRYRRLFKKIATAAVLSAGEEYLATWLAKDHVKDGHFYTSRIPKQAVYGSLIHISINNQLLKGARYLFRGQTSPTSRFLSILFGLLVIAPVQKVILFAGAAIIAGARTWNQVRATVRAELFPVMKVLLFAYPIAVAFASNILPEIAWPQFFDIVNLTINTYGNTLIKKKRLAALRRKYYGKPVIKNEEEEESDAGSIAMPTTLQPPIPGGNLDSGQGDPTSPRGPSYSSDSAVEEEETESDASPIIMPSPYQSYYRGNLSGGSVAWEEGAGLDISQPGAAAAAADIVTTWPLYRADNWQTLDSRSSSSGSIRAVTGRRSEIDSDTSQPEAAATATEVFTTRPLYRADSWQTVDSRNNSSDSIRAVAGTSSDIDSDTSQPGADNWQALDSRDNSSDSSREGMGGESEIDSDTSSELPTRRPWVYRGGRRIRS